MADEVRIRPGCIDDVAPVTAIYNHYVVKTHFTFDIDVWSIEDRRAKWFEQFDVTGRYRLFTAEQAGGDIVGYATSSPFKPKGAYATSVEATIYLHPEHTGNGTGRRLYQTLFDALADEDVHRAYAGVAQPNDVSQRFHESMGFKVIGTYHEVGRKFGKYWDVTWLERPIP